MATATFEPECCDSCGETIFNDSKVNEIISTWHLNFNLDEPSRIPLNIALSVIFEKNLYGIDPNAAPPKGRNLKFCTECGETLTLLYNSFKEFIQLCHLESSVGYMLRRVNDIRKLSRAGFGRRRGSSVNTYTCRLKKKYKRTKISASSPPVEHVQKKQNSLVGEFKTDGREMHMLEIKMETEDNVHVNDSMDFTHDDYDDGPEHGHEGDEDEEGSMSGDNVITPETNSRVTRYQNRNRSKIQTPTASSSKKRTREDSSGNSGSSDEDSESAGESEMESEPDSSSSVDERSAGGVKGKKKYVRRNQTQRRMECPACDRTFKSRYLWKIHILNYHKEECSAEIAEFESEYCAICDHIFRSNLTLRTHREKIHHVRTDKPVRIIYFPRTDEEYQCIAEGCTKTYTTKGMMYEHVKKCHNELEGQLNITPKEKKEPFQRNLRVLCELCGKSIVKIHLKGHMMTHTGEKPYKCDHCDRHFARKPNKRRHMQQVHNVDLPDKPFACQFCGKEFKLHNNCHQHEMQVHGYTPMMCEQCGNTYKSRKALELHMESHLGIGSSPCQICGKVLRDGPSMHRHLRDMHGPNGPKPKKPRKPRKKETRPRNRRKKKQPVNLSPPSSSQSFSEDEDNEDVYVAHNPVPVMYNFNYNTYMHL